MPRALGKKIKGISELYLARITTASLSIVAAIFALYTGDLIAILGAFGWGTFAAAIVPVVTLGFNWKRATPTAANISIISSLVINLAFKLFDWKMPYNIDVGAFSLIVSLFLFISLSLATKPIKLDPGVERVMDM
jgi:Na+/proline symporter